MKFTYIFIISFFLTPTLFGQSLFQTVIRKTSTVPPAAFYSKGIFHSGIEQKESIIKALRHSYTQSSKTERVVLDFEGSNVPRYYSHYDADKGVLNLDLFETQVSSSFAPYGGKGIFLKSVETFQFGEESISLEIKVQKNTNMRIFHLPGPPRIVIDLRL